MKRKLYVIERRGRGSWLPTWWADDFPPEGDGDDGPPPKPVGVAKARKALRFAQECYPKYKYRMTEVGDSSTQKEE